MEIYDNRSDATRTAGQPVAREIPVAVAAVPTQEAAGYWKFCSAVLGAALLIAIVLGSGPGNASASDTHQRTLNYTGVQNHPALVEPVLTISGFDAVDGVPVFVMVDQTGQRVGVMEMPGNAAD